MEDDGERLEPSVAETHISTVFFTETRAYKVLKPIRTSFLDHTSVEARLAAVDAEMELNRRLAPDVYLGTADVIEHDQLVDRMLVMQRLPPSRRLTALADGGGFDECLRLIARAVAAFHSFQEPILGHLADSVAGSDAVRRNWSDNVADLAPLVGDVLDPDEVARVDELADRYLDARRELFARRIDEGFVRDGHGDLRAEDIFCLDDGPRILDCLAFDPRLRIGDVLIDIAFLVMDLDRLVGPSAARTFISYYQGFSNEHHPSSLAHHYIAYRANVRAKIAGIRYRQGDPQAADDLRDYYSLCRSHLERANPVVMLVGGTPGTGKTTLARALSATLEIVLLSTDELRKDLAGRGHLVRELAEPDGGIYSPAMTERTYRELLARTRRLLDQGESVILDASWSQAALRAQARRLAADEGAELVEVECVLDADLARARIKARLADNLDPSDARPELVNELRRRYEPWPSATKIDTAAAPSVALAQARAELPALRVWGEGR